MSATQCGEMVASCLLVVVYRLPAVVRLAPEAGRHSELCLIVAAIGAERSGCLWVLQLLYDVACCDHHLGVCWPACCVTCCTWF